MVTSSHRCAEFQVLICAQLLPASPHWPLSFRSAGSTKATKTHSRGEETWSSSKQTRQCFLEQHREGGSKTVRAPCLQVAHLRGDKLYHQSRAARLPGATAAQRLSQRAAQNRAYCLIISALSHKEELGDGVPYLRSSPLVPSSRSAGASPPVAQVLRRAHVLQPNQLEEGSSSSPLPTPPHPARLAWYNHYLPRCLLLVGREDSCMGLM